MHKSEHLPIDVPEPTERCCYRCGETRPIGMFYVDAERRQTERRGRRSPVRIPCRVCTQATNEAARKPRQDYINKVKLASGCTDCGLIDLEHPEIYDFDHLPGQTKARGVAGERWRRLAHQASTWSRLATPALPIERRVACRRRAVLGGTRSARWYASHRADRGSVIGMGALTGRRSSSCRTSQPGAVWS